MRPVAHPDGHDEPGLIRELVPRLAAVVEDVAVGGEDPVGDPVVAHVLPDVLDGVQLRRLRACLSVRFQGLTLTPQYRPSASSRLWPARPAALCLPDPCGLGSDSHGDKAFSGKLLEFLTQTGSKSSLGAFHKACTPSRFRIERRCEPSFEMCE